ncbi:MAG: NAD(P)H-dependent oxidoreductase [Smithellaceae bacterium]|nr:NAD(P)H-dependent oxidoreductase [Smithellaceae bacterium]
MNIVVLNGSPKGELSVTLQYVRFAARKFPEHTFTIFPVAQTIRKLEKDEKAFDGVINAVRAADAVLWSFPLYFLLVCSQYKRFIELIFERNAQAAFAGKYTASLSTSIHFFDHTAHNYIHAVCDDLAMRYLGAYSPAMFDLMKSKERSRWLSFVERFLDGAARRVPCARVYPPLAFPDFIYTPGPAAHPVDTAGKKILLLKDGRQPSGNTEALADALAARFQGAAEVVNLMDIDIKGGCLGCCKCGLDNVCDYQGKDGFIDFYNEKVKKADVVVFAGAIHDRYLSSRWKMFFDRSFFNTHTPTLIGKQIAFLISGPLGQISNLRQILTAFGEFQEANLAGIVTDESADPTEIDALVTELADALVHPAASGYAPPMTFLGVGGRRIFRDEVYGMLRFVFQSDHRYYKQHGLYDFPQKNYKARRMNAFMMLLTRIPSVRKKFLKILPQQMVKPIKTVAETR